MKTKIMNLRMKNNLEGKFFFKTFSSSSSSLLFFAAKETANKNNRGVCLIIFISNYAGVYLFLDIVWIGVSMLTGGTS